MKWPTFGIVAALLFQSSSAFKHNHFPRRYRHHHHRQRDLVTDLTVVTATVDGGLVIVDQNGHALTTICESCFPIHVPTDTALDSAALAAKTAVCSGDPARAISIALTGSTPSLDINYSPGSKIHPVSTLRTSTVYIPAKGTSLLAATPSYAVSKPDSTPASSHDNTRVSISRSASTHSVSDWVSEAFATSFALHISMASLESSSAIQFFENTTSTSSRENFTFSIAPTTADFSPISEPVFLPTSSVAASTTETPTVQTPIAIEDTPAQNPPTMSIGPPKWQPNQPLPSSLFTITLSQTSPPTLRPSSTLNAPSDPQPVTVSNSSQIPHGFGLAYSPYTASGNCKTAQDIEADISRIVSSLKDQYSYLRIYGTDCDQTLTVGRIANSHGLGIFAGIWSVDTANLATETQYILDALESGITIVAIGIANEALSGNRASLSTIVDAVHSVRTTLRSATYNTPVVAIDTFLQLQSTPELCQISDFPAANAHAFFDPTVAAPAAGVWALQTATQVKQACGGREVLISESGWPRQGEKNGFAVPGMWEQSMALNGIRRMFSSTNTQNPDDAEQDENEGSQGGVGGGMVLYTAFDDLWKKDWPGTFGAERYWGMLGAGSS